MPAKKGRRVTWLSKFMIFLNILVVLALFCSYGARYIDPRMCWSLALAGLAYPIILVINLFFVVLWLVRWKKYIFLSLVSIFIGWTELMTIFPIHFSDPQLSSDETIKMMTYNTHGFNYPKTDKVVTQNRALDFIRKEKPGILCFQEFKPRGEYTIKTLGDTLGLSYSYQKNYLEYKDKEVVYGMAIYSKYPILKTGFLKDDKNRVFAIWTDIANSQDTIRIYNCHLVSVRFGTGDYSFYEDLKNQSTEKIDYKGGIFKIVKKLKRAFISRSGQTDRLVTSIGQSPYPVLLGGDLNDSPFSYSYHHLSGKLKDSYREAGKGWSGNTFAGQLPSYRIDYLMFSKKMKAGNYQKYQIDYSDHYPISVLITKR